MIAYGEDFPEFVASCEGAEPCLADLARLENAWVEAYHAEDATAATVGDLAGLSPDLLPGTRIAFHPAARLLRFSTPAASIWASAQSARPRRANRRKPGGRARHPSRRRRPGAHPAAARLRFRHAPAGGRNADRCRGRAGRPHVRLRNPSGRIDRIRRCRLPRPRNLVMNADAVRPIALAPSIRSPD